MRPFRVMRSGGGGSQAYLDQLSVTPRAALSLRKLISTATVAIRVRRSSDNAEQDIGFSGDALDTTSLASFVGSNSAYVTKVYDQTGNAEHAEQATVANQPRIVNAGTYDGKLVFDGTNDFLKITALAAGSAYAGFYLNAALADATGVQVALETSTNFNTNVGAMVWYMESNLHHVGANNGSNSRKDYDPASLTSLTQVTLPLSFLGSGNDIRMRVAGVEQVQVGGSIVNAASTFSAYDAYIGCRAGGSFFAPLQLETLVYYNADTASMLSSIETLV